MRVGSADGHQALGNACQVTLSTRDLMQGLLSGLADRRNVGMG